MNYECKMPYISNEITMVNIIRIYLITCQKLGSPGTAKKYFGLIQNAYLNLKKYSWDSIQALLMVFTPYILHRFNALLNRSENVCTKCTKNVRN